MPYTETTTKGWFSRITESIKGVLFGILLFAISFPMLYWNEGRAVKQSKSLKDGAASVVSVSSETVESANEGFLIHTTGLAESGQALYDSEFEVTAKEALRLKRKVEMYQWQETKTEEREKKAGGSEKTTVTYSYEKVWSTEVIDSNEFKEEGYENPASMPYYSQTFESRDSTVGAFTLGGSLLSQMSAFEDYPVGEAQMEELARPQPPEEPTYPPAVVPEPEPQKISASKRDPFANNRAQEEARKRKHRELQAKRDQEIRELEQQYEQKQNEYRLALQRYELEQSSRRQQVSKFKEHDGGYYLGDNPEAPVIGDTRISFSVVPEQQVSILAQQQGSGFVAYTTKNGGTIFRLMAGEKTADEMFQQLEKEAAQLTWILRGVGFFFMFLGLMMIFRPLVVVADVVPLFGNLLSAGSFIFAFLLAAPLTLLTIAVSWFAVRPLITIALVIGAGFFGFLALKVSGRKRKT